MKEITEANKFSRYVADNGVEIYRIPIEAFPGFVVYAFLLIVEGKYILVDTGSGLGRSNEDLFSGLALLGEYGHRDLTFSDLDHVIITHAHIDHQGGLPVIKAEAPQVTVISHELSVPALSLYDEFRTLLRHRFYSFLRRSGVRRSTRDKYLDLYNMTRGEYRDTPVDYTLKNGDRLFDTIELIHAPGHAPGLIMLRIADLLISTDHFLPDTSVSLWPECVFPYSGIGLYLDAVEHTANLEGIRLALGSHERAMPDFYEVIGRVHADALEKIERVYDALNEPRTVFDLTHLLYPDMSNIPLLKVVQTGARVEYLSQRGKVEIENLDSLKDFPMLPHRFRRR